MLEKLKEWLAFHSTVMERYPKPGYLMLFSCVIALVASWIYPKVIMAIASFQIGGYAPYQEFVIQNIRYFEIGMWVVPILIFIVLMCISWGMHQHNIEKHYC